MSRCVARVLIPYLGLPEVELEALVGARTSPLEPPILDRACVPPYAGPKEHDDMTPFLNIVNHVHPQNVLELGTAHGNLTANICKQCPGATVYTVNATKAQLSGQWVTYALETEEIGSVCRLYGYGDRVIQIFANSKTLDVSEYLSKGCIDLAIIDACHDRGYVLSDFYKIEPFVREAGVVLFHDTHPSLCEHLLGSYSACMVLRWRGFDIRHVAKTWWAVWVKPATPQPC